VGGLFIASIIQRDKRDKRCKQNSDEDASKRVMADEITTTVMLTMTPLTGTEDTGADDIADHEKEPEVIL
jgi:hypothetical protein